MLDLKPCKGTSEGRGTPTGSSAAVSPAHKSLLRLSLVRAKQQLSPADLCINLLSSIKQISRFN